MLFITSINPIKIVEETVVDKCKMLFNVDVVHRNYKLLVNHMSESANFIVNAQTSELKDDNTFLYKTSIIIHVNSLNDIFEKTKQYRDGYYLISNFFLNRSGGGVLYFNKLEDTVLYTPIMSTFRKDTINSILTDL